MNANSSKAIYGLLKYAMKHSALLIVVAAAMLPGAGGASGKIFYGSRAGMTLTTVSVSGQDSPHAVMRTKHARDDAIAYCREYVQKPTPACIDEQLALPIKDQVTANCSSGEFEDFFGMKYRFEGGANENSELMVEFIIRDLASGEVADGSSASGYSVNLGIFRALCPTLAPPRE